MVTLGVTVLEAVATGVSIAAFIVPFAVGVGAVVNQLMRWLY